MTYVFVGLGMMAFLSASILAIDVGKVMTARNQAQNAADAGALAGATALLYDSYTDRSPGGPAVTSAIAAAQANKVMPNQIESGIVSVESGDVEFLNDPSGEPNRVKVTVYRRADRGNAMTTMVARYFGMDTIGRHGDRDGGSGRRQRDDVREAVHDSRQVGRAADGTLGRRRHVRRLRQQGKSARQPGHLHPGEQARLHGLQPGVGAGPATGDPCGNRQQHHGQLLLLARARKAAPHRRCRVPTGTSRTATRRFTTGTIR